MEVEAVPSRYQKSGDGRGFNLFGGIFCQRAFRCRSLEQLLVQIRKDGRDFDALPLGGVFYCRRDGV